MYQNLARVLAPVVFLMISIVFSGGLIPVTDRIVLEQLTRAVPARWGFAACASTIDLRAVAPFSPATEVLWSHTVSWWIFDMAMLAVCATLLAAFILWHLRLRATAGRRAPARSFSRLGRRHATVLAAHDHLCERRTTHRTAM